MNTKRRQISMTQNNKTKRHNKITGDFGENILEYFLSKNLFETAIIDYVGIDILAVHRKSKKRMGISVKSRSRTIERPKDGVLVPGSSYQKIIEASSIFSCKPWICFIVDKPKNIEEGEIFIFLISLNDLLDYYPQYKIGKDFTFSVGKKNIEKYNQKNSIKKLHFNYTQMDWK